MVEKIVGKVIPECEVPRLCTKYKQFKTSIARGSLSSFCLPCDYRSVEFV